jgi:hypothetical protein
MSADPDERLFEYLAAESSVWRSYFRMVRGLLAEEAGTATRLHRAGQDAERASIAARLLEGPEMTQHKAEALRLSQAVEKSSPDAAAGRVRELAFAVDCYLEIAAQQAGLTEPQVEVAMALFRDGLTWEDSLAAAEVMRDKG